MGSKSRSKSKSPKPRSKSPGSSSSLSDSLGSISGMKSFIKDASKTNKIFLYLLVLFQFLILFFCFLGLFLGHMNSTKEKYEACHYVKAMDYRACYLCKDVSCISLQGYRRNCNEVRDSSMSALGCEDRQNLVSAAYGACVSAIILSFVMMGCAALMAVNVLQSPGVVGTISGLTAMGYHACWVLMICVFVIKLCPDFYGGNGKEAANYKSFTTIGAGMVFVMICAVLQTANTVFIFLI